MVTDQTLCDLKAAVSAAEVALISAINAGTPEGAVRPLRVRLSAAMAALRGYAPPAAVATPAAPAAAPAGPRPLASCHGVKVKPAAAPVAAPVAAVAAEASRLAAAPPPRPAPRLGEAKHVRAPRAFGRAFAYPEVIRA
jgi:hypothetical protein